jgi:polyferredoxin
VNFPPPEFSRPHPFPVVPDPAARPELFAYLDIFALLLALSAAAYLALAKRSRFGLFALMLASLLYFGFWRRGCVCPVGSIQNVARALADPSYALTATAAAFFLLPLLFALFFGRVFCAAVCPLGAMQDVALVRPVRLPPALGRALGVLPFVFLGAAALFAALGSTFPICRFDPFVAFFRFSGPTHMLVAGGAVLLAATLIGRPYCRFACPYGALLAMLGPLARRRASISPGGCTVCTLCRNACPFDAIRAPVPPLEAGERQRKRREMLHVLALLPLLAAAGGWLGFAGGRGLAACDPRVVLARDVRAAAARGARDDSASADAFGRTGGDPQRLAAEAAAREQLFRVGGAFLGAWLGLVGGAFLVRCSRQPARTVYETDPSACLSCGRCFCFCPQEQARIARAGGARA